MIYILGGDGFIGSAFTRELSARGIHFVVINRLNYDDLRGTECDIFINANGNSKKYLAEENPALDFELSVNSVLDSLINFKYDRYIFLSSGDVYCDQSSPETTREGQLINILLQSRYGFHKYIAEQLVRKYAINWLIFRMSGFFGRGLKKNAIFDILNNNEIWLTAKSELQFMSTDEAANIILNIASKEVNNEIINIGGDGVIDIASIYNLAGSKSKYKFNAKTIRYELNLDKLKGILKKNPTNTYESVANFIRKITEK